MTATPTFMACGAMKYFNFTHNISSTVYYIYKHLCHLCHLWN